MKTKISLKDIYYYIQGTLRYKLYYTKLLKFLIPLFIREQIAWRIKIMDIECYEKGFCKMCGCNTTALQMANKPCNKPCYPHMMRRKKWREYKTKKQIEL